MGDESKKIIKTIQFIENYIKSSKDNYSLFTTPMTLESQWVLLDSFYFDIEDGYEKLSVTFGDFSSLKGFGAALFAFGIQRDYPDKEPYHLLIKFRNEYELWREEKIKEAKVVSVVGAGGTVNGAEKKIYKLRQIIHDYFKDSKAKSQMYANTVDDLESLWSTADEIYFIIEDLCGIKSSISWSAFLSEQGYGEESAASVIKKENPDEENLYVKLANLRDKYEAWREKRIEKLG